MKFNCLCKTLLKLKVVTCAAYVGPFFYINGYADTLSVRNICASAAQHCWHGVVLSGGGNQSS